MRRWLVLGVLFLARGVLAYQFQSIASIAAPLGRELGLSHGRIGALIGLYMLPGAAVSLLAGVGGRRRPTKQVCLFGLALMAAGGAGSALATSYEALIAARVVAGVGAAVFNVSFTTMIADWFVGRELVTAMSIALTSWPSGVAVGLVSQGALAEAWSWRAVMHLATGLVGVAGVLVLATYRDPPGLVRAPPTRGHRVRVGLGRILLAGGAWGTLSAGWVLVYSFAPSFLVAEGVPADRAAALVSLCLWVSLLSLPLGGFVVERLRRPIRQDLVVVSFALACGAAAALIAPGRAWLPCVLVGLAIGPPSGAVLSLPTQVVTPDSRLFAYGIVFAEQCLMSALAPAAAGGLRDALGSARAPLLLAAATFAATAPLLIAFRLVTPAPSASARDTMPGP